MRAGATSVRPPAFCYRAAKKKTASGADRDLHCDNVALGALAERFGTPLYVYSATSIRDRLRRFDGAFGKVPHTVCFWVKEDLNRQAQWQVCQFLAELGQHIGAIQTDLKTTGTAADTWVEAYTDFKLHDIASPEDVEPLDMNQPTWSNKFKQGNRRFLTRRLWGAANMPNHFHHGRFTTMRGSVLEHSGEALASRKAYQALKPGEQDALPRFRGVPAPAVGAPDGRQSLVRATFPLCGL